MVYVGPGRNSKLWLNELLKEINSDGGVSNTPRVSEDTVNTAYGFNEGAISKRPYVCASSSMPGINEGRDFSYTDFGVVSVKQYDVSDSKIALVTTYTGENPFNFSVVDLNHVVSKGDGRRTNNSKLHENRQRALSVIDALDQHFGDQDVSVIGDADYGKILDRSDKDVAIFLVNK